MSEDVQSPYARGFYFCSASCACIHCLHIDGRRFYHFLPERPLFKGGVDKSKIPAPRDFPPLGA